MSDEKDRPADEPGGPKMVERTEPSIARDLDLAGGCEYRVLWCRAWPARGQVQYRIYQTRTGAARFARWRRAAGAEVLGIETRSVGKWS